MARNALVNGFGHRRHEIYGGTVAANHGRQKRYPQTGAQRFPLVVVFLRRRDELVNSCSR